MAWVLSDTFPSPGEISRSVFPTTIQYRLAMAKKDKPKRPQTPLDQLPIERRLAVVQFSADDYKDAIHGQRVPKTLGQEVHRFCTIRGIRYHHGFAEELRRGTPDFTRALNARDIKSGFIPNMSESNANEGPYCIWNPDVPSEDILRLLVQKYPSMIYHAARTCAVDLYFDCIRNLILSQSCISQRKLATQAEREIFKAARSFTNISYLSP